MPGYVLYTFSLFLPLWPDLKGSEKRQEKCPTAGFQGQYWSRQEEEKKT